jgi:glycosyltransferase involved in cell wall biosynthesis
MNNDTLIILTPGFPKNEDDTTCLPHIQQFILPLSLHYPNINITIIAFQYPYNSAQYKWHGTSVYSLGGKNKAKIFGLHTWFKAYQLLKRLKLKTNIIGVLSIFHTECALVGNIFCKRNNIKHISWLQGQDAKKTNRYANIIKAKPNELAALSFFLQEEFYKNHGVKPLHIFDNGILESAFPSLNKAVRDLDIIGVGSLIPLKNYSLFVEIINELKKTFPTIKTAIVGEGKEFAKLQQLITDLQLQQHVELLGLKPHAETLNLMNNSKVFLHTSDYEGSCSAILESLHSGCNVVSTCNPANLNYPQFFYSINKTDLIAKLTEFLNEKNVERKRTTYNTIDNTAKQVMDLYLV